MFERDAHLRAQLSGLVTGLRLRLNTRSLFTGRPFAAIRSGDRTSLKDVFPDLQLLEAVQLSSLVTGLR